VVNQSKKQQQLSHLSQVFGVGYMNQRELHRIGHMDHLSQLIPIEQNVSGVFEWLINQNT